MGGVIDVRVEFWCRCNGIAPVGCQLGLRGNRIAMERGEVGARRAAVVVLESA